MPYNLPIPFLSSRVILNKVLRSKRSKSIMRKHVNILLVGLLCFVTAGRVHAQEAQPGQPSATPFPQSPFETKFDPDQPIKAGFQIGIFVSTAEGPEEPSTTQVVDASG